MKGDKPYCQLCNGTGFDRPGHICPHITGERPVGCGDMPDFMRDIFEKGSRKPVDEK